MPLWITTGRRRQRPDSDLDTPPQVVACEDQAVRAAEEAAELPPAVAPREPDIHPEHDERLWSEVSPVRERGGAVMAFVDDDDCRLLARDCFDRRKEEPARYADAAARASRRRGRAYISRFVNHSLGQYRR